MGQLKFVAKYDPFMKNHMILMEVKEKVLLITY